MIQIGDTLPDVEVFEANPSQKSSTGQLFEGKRCLLFGVIGAFTSGCSKVHLSGYVAEAGALHDKGYAEIFCVSVNDAAVMSAWGASQGAEGKVRLLADPQGALTKALGLDIQVAHLGGLRSKRYAMIVDNGVVTDLQVEPDSFGLTCSLASSVLDRA